MAQAKCSWDWVSVSSSTPGALWLFRLTPALKAMRKRPALVRCAGKLNLVWPGSAGHHRICLLMQLRSGAMLVDVLAQGCSL